MDAFAASRLRWFQGRTHELEQLTDFLDTTTVDAPRLAVVAAVPGQGKSALLAHLHGQLKSSPHFVITHFVGATERSATPHALVERLLAELDRSAISWPSGEEEGKEAKRDFNSICLRLAHRLGDYAGEHRVVILLDALNQLSDGHDLQWLPTRLGASVRVIASCVEDATAKADSPEQRVLQAFASRHSAPLRVTLGPLTETDVRTIAVSYLKEYCHELDRRHLDSLCAIRQVRNPLYLLVMLNELRTLGGNDLNRIVPALIASMPEDHPDTVSLFRWVLRRLEVFGTEAVRWWCLYLAHGRIGMASHELADLLGRKLGVDAAHTALLIERGLRRYLQHRGPQLDFFHGQLRQAVFEQYGPQAEVAKVNSDIASHFCDLADPEGNQSWKGENPRPILEVAFHLAVAQRLDELCQTLCCLHFVAARCRMGQVFELVEDYRLAHEQLPEAQAARREEGSREESARHWTNDLIAYAQAWSGRRDRKARGETVNEPEPRLPALPPSCRMWTGEEIDAECQRITQGSSRADRLSAFAGFVSSECYPLQLHGKWPPFVMQHAFNCEPTGPVHDAATLALPALKTPHFLRRWSAEVRSNPMPALVRSLEGHKEVACVSTTPDGRRAVSGGDQTVRVWDLESGQCLWILEAILEGHPGQVLSVSITPDGLRAISGSGQPPMCMEGPAREAYEKRWHGSDKLKLDNWLRVWNLEDGQCLRILEGHSDYVTSVSLTPDGRRAVSGSGDKTLRVWDLDTGECLHILEGHNDRVSCVCVTPDGRRAVSGSQDNTLRVWDLEGGQCLRILEGTYPGGGIKCVSVTPDGQLALAGGAYRTVLWNLETGQCLQTLRSGTDHMDTDSVSMTPDGRRAVSSCSDMTMRVWDLANGQCLRALKGHYVASVSVTCDGQRAVSGGNSVAVWNLERGQHRIVQGHVSWVRRVWVTPDGRLALSAGERDSDLHVWEVESARCLRSLEVSASDLDAESVTVTPDSRRALSVSSKNVRVWDLETGACLRSLEGHVGNVLGVSVTPDGRRAVSGSHDKTLRVWDLETGECLHVLEGHSARVACVSVLPDGRRAVSGSWDKTLRVWDLINGRRIHTLEGHSNHVSRVSVTPDGRCAVSGGPDGTRVWDLGSGQCLRTLEHLEVHGMSMTRGEQLLVRGPTYVGVLDLQGGRCLRLIEGHTRTRGVRSLSVSTDGRCAMWIEDKTLQVWDLASGTCQGVVVLTVPGYAIAESSGKLVVGLESGEVVLAEMRNVAIGPTILTAINPKEARCPGCGQEFGPPPTVVTAIRDAEVPGLLSQCPNCRRRLLFNPFFAADDTYYTQVLRRGLERSRREKGDDHEETLAHLAALAVNLEEQGKPEEAAELKQESDPMAARAEAKRT